MSGAKKAWEAIEGDCLEVLADIPDGIVDAVITDPPYGCQDANQVQGHSLKSVRTFGFDWNVGLPVEYLWQCHRVLKPGGSLVTFTDTKRVETIWNAIKATGLNPLQLFYWLKTNPPPQPRKNFQSGVEVAIFARKPGKVLFWGGGGASLNYFKTPIAMGKDRTKHPTQKHVEVMEHLIRLVCPEGGVVLDPFAGSGTTGVAGLLTGRRTLLIEKDSEYFSIMLQRMKKWEKSDRVLQFELGGV